MRRSNITRLLVAACGIAFVAACYFATRPAVEEKPIEDSGTDRRTVQIDPQGLSARTAQYSGSESCRQCHDRYYESWHDTYHRTMTQEASPDSIVASFDNVTLESRGRAFKLTRDGDSFFATPKTTQPEARSGPPMKIAMTTGSHLMQTYWVRFGSAFRQLPWFYHIESKKWIPSNDSFLTPPDGPPMEARWNDTCVKCHTTGPVPGMLADRQNFDTKVAELGISCEACHGPAAEHVGFHSKNENASQVPPSARLVNPAKLSHVAASQICGQCHSSAQANDRIDWLVNGSRYFPGDDHTKWFTHAEFGSTNPVSAAYVKDSYWNDGTCRVGGDELLGMEASKCYSEGQMSCLTCHSMHDSDPTDQLKSFDSSNGSCLQCHNEFQERLEEHTHHPIDSSGSQCVNCHMPHTSFALFKAIRSHRIDSPAVTGPSKGARPNACNLCHLDQTLAWSAAALEEWYGHDQPELPESDRTRAASLQWLLQGDATQRAIVAWHLSWTPASEVAGDKWKAPFLAELLADPYSVVRFISWRSLLVQKGFAEFEYDFLKSRPELLKSRDLAVRLWQATRKSQDGDPRLFLLKDGQLDADAVKATLKQRDDRPIDILE